LIRANVPWRGAFALAAELGFLLRGIRRPWFTSGIGPEFGIVNERLNQHFTREKNAAGIRFGHFSRVNMILYQMRLYGFIFLGRRIPDNLVDVIAADPFEYNGSQIKKCRSPSRKIRSAVCTLGFEGDVL
jgi:hypothetical protein